MRWNPYSCRAWWMQTHRLFSGKARRSLAGCSLSSITPSFPPSSVQSCREPPLTGENGAGTVTLLTHNTCAIDWSFFVLFSLVCLPCISLTKRKIPIWHFYHFGNEWMKSTANCQINNVAYVDLKPPTMPTNMSSFFKINIQSSTTWLCI